MTLLDWMTAEVMGGVEPLGLHPSIVSAIERAVEDRLETELPNTAATAEVNRAVKAQVGPVAENIRGQIVDVAKAVRHRAAQMEGDPEEIAEEVAEGMRSAI